MPDKASSRVPTIRPALLADAGGTGSVHARSQHAKYRGIVSAAVLARITVAERTQWWTRALSSHDETWLDLVAEAEDEIVGFSCTGPTGLGAGSSIAAYDVYALYVAPDCERQGIGSRLLERTFDWLRARAILQVQVLCLAETSAHQFYEALGGRRVEESQHSDKDGAILRHLIYVYDLVHGSAGGR